MLLVTHLAVGAAIGEAVHGLPGAPAIAFVLGVASHYVLDALPHWEKLSGEKFPDNDTSEPLKKWPRASIKSATIDGISGLLCVAAAARCLLCKSSFLGWHRRRFA
jgi:hypothetical protein